jgi:hypothetical protein
MALRDLDATFGNVRLESNELETIEHMAFHSSGRLRGCKIGPMTSNAPFSECFDKRSDACSTNLFGTVLHLLISPYSPERITLPWQQCRMHISVGLLVDISRMSWTSALHTALQYSIYRHVKHRTPLKGINL